MDGLNKVKHDSGPNAELFPDKYIDDIGDDPEDNYFTPVWDDVCSEISFRSLLDVGCGNGVFSAKLKRSDSCRLAGVDSSSYALEKAREAGFDEVKLVKDFCSEPLPFGPGEFDMIVCKDVLEHLLDPEFLLREIHRVLSNGSYFLAHVPNHFTLWGRVRFLFKGEIDTFHYFPDAERWNFPHIRFFTHESFIKLLRINGFETVMDLSRHFPSIPYRKYLPMQRHIERYLTTTYPTQFAEGFTVLCRKVSK